MSEKGNKKNPVYEVLKYAVICIGGAAIIFVLFGMQLSIFSLAQLGLFILLVCAVTGIFNTYWKLQEAVREAGPEGEEETPQKAAKSAAALYIVSKEKSVVDGDADNGDATSEEEEEDVNSSEFVHRIVSPHRKLRNYQQKMLPILLLFFSIIGILSEYIILRYFKSALTTPSVSVIIVAILAVIVSMALVIVTNLLANTDDENRPKEFDSLRQYYTTIRIMGFVVAIITVLGFFGLWQVDLVANYILAALNIILLLELIIQCAAWLLDGNNNGIADFQLFILPALLSGKNPIEYILKTLEEKSGITIRSSWTLYFIRKNVTVVLLLISVFFWGMTSFVQINPQQEGVIYTFGKLTSEESLKPGVHVKLPWPIETVKTYNTTEMQYFTVGFETSSLYRENYLWTSGHGREEYKILLGSGRELVSLNVIVYYKISDLYNYVKQYQNPAVTLQAAAYEELLNEIVVTNLDVLLSADRTSLAAHVEDHLNNICRTQKLGIEAMAVSISNIHPPVEIGDAYQGVVSATINKNTNILSAQAYADSSIPKAEQVREAAIAQAEIEAASRRGDSYSQVYSYNFNMQAYELNRESYEFWKRLETFETALADKPLYLIDKNIKDENIIMDLRPSTTTSGSIPIY